MRKSSPILDPLFNPLMQDVLAATALRPKREWYLSDLAAHLGVGPSSLQRTIAKLVQAGILNRRRDGNRVYYGVDLACPILGELTDILTKTVGIAEPLRYALRPLAGKIRVAFIHGSVAEGRERSESDVDVIIVGDVPALDLTAASFPLQDRMARAVNFTRYSAKEFREKIAAGNPFLTSVLKRRRIFLIGDEHELGKAAGRKTSRARADNEERA